MISFSLAGPSQVSEEIKIQILWLALDKKFWSLYADIVNMQKHFETWRALFLHKSGNCMADALANRGSIADEEEMWSFS